MVLINKSKGFELYKFLCHHNLKFDNWKVQKMIKIIKIYLQINMFKSLNLYHIIKSKSILFSNILLLTYKIIHHYQIKWNITESYSNHIMSLEFISYTIYVTITI